VKKLQKIESHELHPCLPHVGRLLEFESSELVDKVILKIGKEVLLGSP